MRERGQGAVFWLAVVTCLWFPFQDLVLAFLYGQGVPAMAIKGLLLLKEALLVLILFGALLRWTLGRPLPVTPADVLALCYLALVTAYLPVGNAELQPRLAQYRALVLPAALYLAGRALPAEPRAVRVWIRWTVGLGLLLAATGLIERFALDVGFWRSAVPLDGISAISRASKPI